MIVCSIRRCYINRAWIQSAGLMFIRRADIQSATMNQQWSISGTRHSKLDSHYNSDWNEGFIRSDSGLKPQWLYVQSDGVQTTRLMFNQQGLNSSSRADVHQKGWYSISNNQPEKWSWLIFILSPIQSAVIELVLRISLQSLLCVFCSSFLHFVFTFNHFSTPWRRQLRVRS